MRKLPLVYLAAFGLLFLAEGSLHAQKLTAKENAFFEKSVRPLLAKHCYKCHSKKTGKSKGGLYLDSQAGWMDGGDSGPAITAGSPEKSLLIKAVKHQDKDLEMPPKEKLSDSEIAVLTRWVRMGAPDPRKGPKADKPIARSTIDIAKGRQFWAFRKPEKPAVPLASNGSWALGDIDRFILKSLEEKKLKPADDADRATLIRRATFDLTGLPPSPEEIDSFINDKSPRAFETVVDRLLASKRFGERWGRHWLDIARYGESTGRTRNFPFTFAWRYRDYVIDSFNDDKPYDVFLREQVAGDLLAKKNPQNKRSRLVATGFLAMGSKDLNERNREQYLMDNVDDQIDTTTRSVLALTVSCARCHDHKFDPIPTKDYYALAGIFESTEILSGLNARGQKGGYKAPDKLIALSTRVKPDGAKISKSEIQTQKLQERMQELRAEMRETQKALGSVNKKNGKKKRDRAASAASASQRKEHQKRLQELKKEVQELNKTLNKKKNRGGGSAPTGDYAMGVTDAPRAVNSRVRIRGEVSNKGSEVSRGFLQVLSGKKRAHFSSNASGRLQLADWLTSKENPLTARVMANRVWHHLFGRGIVRTVDNFGETGERPTHPELLDHLAVTFQQDGWSVKGLIRKLVLSRTYRMSSSYSKAHYAVDPGNELLWRMRQKRIDAESLRDSMLAIGGELELSRPVGSPVMKLPINEIGRTLARVKNTLDGNYRSIYLPIMRSFVPPILQTFDFAEPSMVKGNRDVTTVPTQALYLMNNPFVHRQSRNLARTLMEQDGLTNADRIELAYKLALSRAPTTFESIRSLTYLKSFQDKKEKGSNPDLNALASLCHALFSVAEFRYLN